MLDHVVVKDWMTAPVLTVSPETPISEAHQKMKEYGIRRFPVVDKFQRLVGIVTLGDIREASPSDATLLSIWELNYLWAQLTVGKIMTRQVLTVKPETPMIDAAELMLHNKVSGLPVVDDSSKIVGILTESDVFKMLVKSRSVAMIPVND